MDQESSTKMGKSISIQQKTLGIALIIAIFLQYLNFYSLPILGQVIILVVAIILLLK